MEMVQLLFFKVPDSARACAVQVAFGHGQTGNNQIFLGCSVSYQNFVVIKLRSRALGSPPL